MIRIVLIFYFVTVSLSCFWGIVLRVLITIGITVTFMFYKILISLAKYRYLYYLNIRTIDLTFIVIITMFRPICTSAFFRCFMSNSGVHTEFRTEPFIWTIGVDRGSNSVNHDQIQVLSYCKYSLLFLPVVGIEPATSWWVHSEAPTNRTLYSLRYEFLPVQIKSSVQDSVGTFEFDMKHLKKTEVHIGRNFVIITIKTQSIVRIFLVVIIMRFHLRNLDK